jgi:glucose/arabinose dehydrogenase
VRTIGPNDVQSVGTRKPFSQKPEKIMWNACCRGAVAPLVLAMPHAGCAQTSLPLGQIKLPPGFFIELIARVPGAREMTWGERGTLFVGSRQGDVHAVTFAAPNAQGAATVIASGLRDPAGVAFRNGALYVSAVSRILRFDDIERSLASPPTPVVVTDRFPEDGHHARKFIAFGPDGKLYVPVGAPCNICDPDSNQYTNIADECGRLATRSRRAWRAQHGGLRLGPSHHRAVVAPDGSLLLSDDGAGAIYRIRYRG